MEQIDKYLIPAVVHLGLKRSDIERLLVHDWLMYRELLDVREAGNG